MMLNHFKMKLSFYSCFLILNITHAFSQAKILDFCTEDMNEAQGQEYAKSKGGPKIISSLRLNILLEQVKSFQTLG